MSTTNLAGFLQSVFSFKFPLKGDSFSQAMREGVKPGIYKGAALTRVSDTQVSVAPFIAYLNCDGGTSGDNKIMKWESTSPYTFTVSTSSPTMYISHSYAAATASYPDFGTRASTAAPVLNEVCFGTAVYSGSVLTGFDYSQRNYGEYYADDNYATHTEDLYVHGTTFETSPNKNVLDVQISAVLDPGATPTNRDRYIITDKNNLHANFGTITSLFDGTTDTLTNGDIVEYRTKWSAFRIYRPVVGDQIQVKTTATNYTNDSLTWNGTSWFANNIYTTGNIIAPNLTAGAWDSSLTYTSGSVVIQDSILYQANTSVTNQSPATDDGTYWHEYNTHLVGEPFPVFSNSGVVPHRCLELNGSTGYSTTAYPRLANAWAGTIFVASGVITLPDMRDNYLRGWDHTRTLGEYQADQLQGFQLKVHSLYPGASFPTALASSAGTPTVIYSTLGGADTGQGLQADEFQTLGSYGTPRVGTKTFPSSIDVMWCVKY